MSNDLQAHTFTHSLLGPLTGRISPTTPDVVHFRSIPFATISARFRQSVLLDHIPASHSRDFTKYGSLCPEPGAKASSGGEKGKIYDEFKCLNLVVSVPRVALDDSGNGGGLPVMVYVHGGGFVVGSTFVDERDETTKLVELSIAQGTPVIIVSIHYRVNWLGFLASHDLFAEAATFTPPESGSNFALYDQRNAFLWIHAQISGFGGNPKNITAFGESAGSASIALHMCTSIPLFNRAILMSGTAAALPLHGREFKEREYWALLGFLGIEFGDDEGGRKERLRKLREVEWEKVVDVGGQGMQFFHPAGDETFFDRGVPTHFDEEGIVGSCEWVDGVVIGESFSEGSLLSSLLENVKMDEFFRVTTAAMGVTRATKILEAYDIIPSMDTNLFWSKLTTMMGDTMFSQPAHKLTRALAASNLTSLRKMKIYRYHQTIRNPFIGDSQYQIPGPHAIEQRFLFGTLKARYTTRKQSEISDEYGKRWIAFANGKAPWKEFGEEENVMVIGGGKGFELRTRREDELKSESAEEGATRYRAWAIVQEVMDDLVRERGVAGAADARMEWTTDGGIYRLAGLKGPFGGVLS